MPRTKHGINKSEEIRAVYRSYPRMPVSQVVSTLADKGINVSANLVYYVKGRMAGRKGRRKKARQIVEKVATTTGTGDALTTILKVKRWAVEVGGLRKLKGLVDALSE